MSRAGAEQLREEGRGRDERVVAEVRERVDEGEADHRVADEAVERDGVVDWDDAPEGALPDPREHAAHHRDEDEGAVEVEARTAPARELDEGVRAEVLVADDGRNEERDVREPPHGEEPHLGHVVLEEAREALAEGRAGGRMRRRALEAGVEVLVRRDPAGLVAEERREHVGVRAEDGGELVEADAAVAVRVGLAEQSVGERAHVGRAHRHVVLGEAERDHPLELLAGDRAVAVVVVEAEGERELLLLGAEDEPTHGREELVLVDHAVAVHVEDREHAPREVRALEAEGLAQDGRVDAPAGARELAEARREQLDQVLVDLGRAGAFGHRGGSIAATSAGRPSLKQGQHFSASTVVSRARRALATPCVGRDRGAPCSRATTSRTPSG